MAIGAIDQEMLTEAILQVLAEHLGQIGKRMNHLGAVLAERNGRFHRVRRSHRPGKYGRDVNGADRATQKVEHVQLIARNASQHIEGKNLNWSTEVQVEYRR